MMNAECWMLDLNVGFECWILDVFFDPDTDTDFDFGRGGPRPSISIRKVEGLSVCDAQVDVQASAAVDPKLFEP